MFDNMPNLNTVKHRGITYTYLIKALHLNKISVNKLAATSPTFGRYCHFNDSIKYSKRYLKNDD